MYDGLCILDLEMGVMLMADFALNQELIGLDYISIYMDHFGGYVLTAKKMGEHGINWGNETIIDFRLC